MKNDKKYIVAKYSVYVDSYDNKVYYFDEHKFDIIYDNLQDAISFIKNQDSHIKIIDSIFNWICDNLDYAYKILEI